MKWLSRKEAAERVGRNLVTIYRWERYGWLVFTLGRCNEQVLLEADRMSEAKNGRPRK